MPWNLDQLIALDAADRNTLFTNAESPESIEILARIRSQAAQEAAPSRRFSF